MASCCQDQVRRERIQSGEEAVLGENIALTSQTLCGLKQIPLVSEETRKPTRLGFPAGVIKCDQG